MVSRSESSPRNSASCVSPGLKRRRFVTRPSRVLRRARSMSSTNSIFINSFTVFAGDFFQQSLTDFIRGGEPNRAHHFYPFNIRNFVQWAIHQSGQRAVFVEQRIGAVQRGITTPAASEKDGQKFSVRTAFSAQVQKSSPRFHTGRKRQAVRSCKSDCWKTFAPSRLPLARQRSCVKIFTPSSGLQNLDPNV